MKPMLFLAATLLATSALAQRTTPQPQTLPAPPTTLRLLAPEARQPIQLEAVAVQASAVGLQAQTRVELTLRNPNARELEATLEFPLHEGQSVSGFALDIHGVLVPAVPVPEGKGRQVFDDVTRRRVDPALLERTAGNSFKLRVYPLPAGGTRRVVLQVTEALRRGPQGRVRYQLPLDFGQSIGHFSAAITVQGVTRLQPMGALQGVVPGVENVVVGSSAVGAAGRPQASVRLQRQQWRPQGPLAVQWQASGGDLVQVASFDDRAHFYADVALDAAPGPAVLPRELTLVWDASGSGAQRDHTREWALLDALFSAARQVRVRLVLARDVAEAPVGFEVQNGDWRMLRQALDKVAYDGASNAAAWVPTVNTAASGERLTLLFSDGLANWQAGAHSAAPAMPVFTVNAAPRGDAARLRRLAESSGGRYIDLLALSPAQALDALTQPSLHLIDLQAVGAEKLVAASVHPEGGRLAVAGLLTAPQARLTLTLADGRGRRVVRTLDVSNLPAEKGTARSDAVAEADMVPLPAQRWAELTVAQLEGERRQNRAQLRRLGERYRLVSAETSLIVLDALADYLRYDIVPPAGPLRVDYLAQQSRRETTRQQSRSSHLDSLAKRFADKQRWWERDFPKDKPSPVETTADSRPRPAAMAAPMPGFAPPPPPAPVAVTADNAAQESTLRARVPGLQRADTARAAGGAPAPNADSGPNARIELRRWEANAPYARRLREATQEERYAVYMDERAGQLNSTAFFIDAADIFFAKGQPALALRVLSNLAEMELENRQILRILAYRLQQADVPAEARKLALPLLEQVRELAPDEPQSSRDLALALAADGQNQRALDLLWDVASNPWAARFADIDLIALAELNTLAAKATTAGRAVDTSRIDTRLLRNLPLDLRAVLTWDADNTDIDLWVIDPNGEKAFYGHRLTRQGGAMSRDFTGGYGPEEFSLRVAKPGRYEVRAQFYGHQQQIVSPYTTLMLWLSTGFGTPAQKDEQVVLRLSSARDEVLVGSFEVAPPASGAR